MGCSIQLTASNSLILSAPLLEKERHIGGATLIAHGYNPFAFHWTSISTAFAAHYHPRYPLQIQLSEILKERFY
jgi:hypothetical protein